MSRYRTILLLTPIIIGTIALTYNVVSPNRYTALARLLPPRTNTATAPTMLNQIGGAESIGASALTLKSPSELYASLFLSRSVQDDIIVKYGLTRRYAELDMDALRQILTEKTHVDVREDGIIELRYDDERPIDAANIVNGMIEAVYRKAQQLSKVESDNRIAFYDQIIGETRARLTRAEVQLRKLELETGYTRLKGQEEATSLTAGDLESALLARETQLARMLTTATESHPAVRKMRAEISALRAKRQEMDSSDHSADGGILLSVNSFPSLQARIDPARHEVDIQKEVLEYLMKARQLSRVDEKRDLSNVQVLDHAVAPTRKSGPRTARNTALAAGIAFMLATMLCLAWDVLFQNRRCRRQLLRILRPYVKLGKTAREGPNARVS